MISVADMSIIAETERLPTQHDENTSSDSKQSQ